jgi:hypothetical protein
LAFELTDEHGASSRKQLVLVVSGVTGVEDAARLGVQFFPNPASTYCNVLLNETWQGKTEFVLYSMSGQQVRRQSAAGHEVQIDVSGLAPGLYMLKISSNSKTAMVKIVKE